MYNRSGCTALREMKQAADTHEATSAIMKSQNYFVKRKTQYNLML
jgi:hypothetical protein